ncbi:MAG: hypothetical protein ACLT76_05705 [Clostridium fessum]
MYELIEYSLIKHESARKSGAGVTLVENTAGDHKDTKAWEILREIARARSCLLKAAS